MTARTTLVLLSLSFAMIACNHASDSDTLELAEVATSAPALDDTDLPDDVLVVDTAPTELADAEPSEPLDAGDVVEPEPLTVSFHLRYGETLHHYARWSGLPVEVIAEQSGLDLSGHYAAGAPVIVPIDDEEQGAVITAARDAHHAKMAEGYLASRGGAIDFESITVRTGDSATSIARDQQGIPLWLLQTYNPEVNLDRIRPGQDLLVPVLADIVVDADQIPE